MSALARRHLQTPFEQRVEILVAPWRRSLIDRLVHATVVTLNGKSYRLKERGSDLPQRRWLGPRGDGRHGDSDKGLRLTGFGWSTCASRSSSLFA